MKTLLLIPALVLAVSGCSSKTPEEIEAAKYPKVERLSPEQEQAARERFGAGATPRTGPPPANR
jgi:hypothetical protein